MKKTNKNSIIEVITWHALMEIGSACILQLEHLPFTVDNEDTDEIEQVFMVEYVTKYEDLEETDEQPPFMDEPQAPTKSKAQMELETALDTVLNKDPLGRYDGQVLRVPFDKGDIQWVEWVLEHMHNQFIRDKVELIRKSGYGNLPN